MLFLVLLVISDLYLFHLIVLLNPVRNCSKNLLLSCVGKVTTGTYNFVSLILNVAFVGLLTTTTAGSATGSSSLVALLVVTQFSVHVKKGFILKLINGISNVFLKLLTCFNGTTTSTFSISVLLFSNFPVILVL